MSRVDLECGVVYEKRDQLFLAVSNRILISFQQGKWVELRPIVKYRALRDVSVRDLCQHWKVKLEDLDAVTKQYFNPTDSRERQERGRKARVWSDGNWRMFRTVRHNLNRRAG